MATYTIVSEELVKRTVTYEINCDDCSGTDEEIKEELEELLAEGNLDQSAIIEIQEDEDQVVISRSAISIINNKKQKQEEERAKYGDDEVDEFEEEDQDDE
ncbi:hypothetical protein [Photobacterium leiognathi]|uniref:hypothetical protein n=1 Tax=Photobacterium leiognathi TaxID=553611 RepID=UPI0029812378|nr:hypothetical protein [Photobacterium leiognathi]